MDFGQLQCHACGRSEQFPTTPESVCVAQNPKTPKKSLLTLRDTLKRKSLNSCQCDHY